MSIQHEIPEGDIHEELCKEGIEVARVREVAETNITGMRSDSFASVKLEAQVVNIRACWIISNVQTI
jgi:hypothetical protein